MTPEEENISRKLFDRNEIIEIHPNLLRVLTPAEVAEVDQLLAMRFAVAESALGLGKGLLSAQHIKYFIDRLNEILKEANKRLDSAG